MNESIEKNIKKKNIIIESFKLNDNHLVLKSDENKVEYMLNIKNGSVDAKIKNCQGDDVGLKYLEKGDLIKIKGYKNSDKFILKKIYIKTKYLFNSESSEDFEIY